MWTFPVDVRPFVVDQTEQSATLRIGELRRTTRHQRGVSQIAHRQIHQASSPTHTPRSRVKTASSSQSRRGSGMMSSRIGKVIGTPGRRAVRNGPAENAPWGDDTTGRQRRLLPADDVSVAACRGVTYEKRLPCTTVGPPHYRPGIRSNRSCCSSLIGPARPKICEHLRASRKVRT